jgi:hypothetical protein
MLGKNLAYFHQITLKEYDQQNISILPRKYSCQLSDFIFSETILHTLLRCKSALCRLNIDYVICDAFDANRYRNL